MSSLSGSSSQRNLHVGHCIKIDYNTTLLFKVTHINNTHAEIILRLVTVVKLTIEVTDVIGGCARIVLTIVQSISNMIY